MMRNIYFAAPLHDEADQKRNAKYVAELRATGAYVYLPQEHGLWEDFPDPESARKELYQLDMDAMKRCDTCIVVFGNKETPRAPSEGALFEMGWMKGANKTVILFNEDNYWRFNLMPEFGADKAFTDWMDLLEWLRNQG